MYTEIADTLVRAYGESNPRRRADSPARRGVRVPEAALADLALGEAKIALHAPGEAMAPLEHAIAIGEQGIDPIVLGDIRLALARALDATHGDPDRASKLASQAADDYTRGHHAERAASARASR